MRYAIELSNTVDPEDIQSFMAELDAYNDDRVGFFEPVVPLLVVIKDHSTGVSLGGAWGKTFWQWLFIEGVYVAPGLRRRGVGTALMQSIEAEAVARSCIGIWLDTFSFQARPFYERLGFSVFGEIEDYPLG